MMTEHEAVPPAAADSMPDWDRINWKPRFFTLWIGQSFSMIGSALTQFILIWWITDTVGSASALSIAGIMALLPQAIFGPLGGTLADRWNRRLIMIVTDTITALCIVVLSLLFATDQVELWHIYLLMFVRSTMQAFQGPASVATTSMIVPPSWLSRVAGMNQTVQGLMGIASAPLGAVALAIMPLQSALMIDVVTALFAIIPLIFMRIPQIRVEKAQQLSVWQDFKVGLRFVAQHAGLLRLYGLATLLVAVIMPCFVLIPLLVKEEFGGGVNEVALMEGVSGIGMILGGVAISLIRMPPRQIRLVLIGYAVTCFTVVLLGLMPGHMFVLAVVVWFINGAVFTIGNAPVTSILQRIVPNQMQGRVLSLLSTVIGLASPLGLMLAGPLGELIGVRGLLIAGGLISTVISLAGLFSPALLRIEDGALDQA